jgi:hypothetical protein
MSRFWSFLAQAGRGNRRQPRRCRTLRPTLELLERRDVPTTFAVTTTADAGPGSLRQAILDANGSATSATINFNITGAGVHTITPLSPLPTITTPGTVINGTSEPGWTGKPLIELDGASAGAASGLVTSAGAVTIESLIINRFQYFGIALESNVDAVFGCWIGTDQTGTAPAGNGFSGIFLSGSACNIGGTIAWQANVLSGNGYHGIQMQNGAGQNQLTNNLIGLNAAGTAALGNQYDGVAIFLGAKLNEIGGAAANEGNVISGNDRANISILSPGTTGNLVEGNKIGTNAAGTAAVPPTRLPPAGNDNGIGVWILGGATANVVGGSAAGDRNVISGNSTSGVQIQGTGTSGNLVEQNFVGLNAAGSGKLGNTLSGVVIESAASGNTIGGALPGDANYIAANGNSGVEIHDAGTVNNTVDGNAIGYAQSGSAAVGNTYDGVAVFLGASNNTVGGVGNAIWGNGRAGVTLTSPGTTENVIEANTIGAQTAKNGIGVWIAGGASENSVGGTTIQARNILSYNATYGIVVSDSGTTGNLLEGNYIGLNNTGTAANPNGSAGILIGNGASGNTVGGTTAGSGNVVSGNDGNGIHIQGPGSNNNVIEGNSIGCSASGTAAVANNGNGILIDLGASNNAVGNTASGVGNVILGNSAAGVMIADAGTTGNLVGFNTIGLSMGGAAFGNLTGVLISNGASNNTIGGAVRGSDRNVIAGNYDGIIIANSGTSANVVQNNLIGVNATGTAGVIGGDTGILIDKGASDNVIGGPGGSLGNVIAPQGDVAISIDDAGTSGNVVQGNIIGLNEAGTAAMGTFLGVQIINATNTTVGGPGPSDGNVISGNTSEGITIAGPNTSVEGNYVGTNVAGNAAIGNQDGIFVDANNNTIGGTSIADRNYVSGNTEFGILIYGSNNNVQGNSIGGAPSGSLALGNTSDGIFLTGGAANNMIGGTANGASNTIIESGGDGVLIGSDPAFASGQAAGIGNSVLGNSISLSGGVAIDLGPDDGVTPNGFNGNVGPNDYQNYPVLLNAVSFGNATLVSGKLTSATTTTFRIEFFEDITGSASGHGEGLIFVGFINVYVPFAQSSASNTASFNADLPVVLPSGRIISATATNLATGDTSEFAANIRVS